jgi:hypothetical protein
MGRNTDTDAGQGAGWVGAKIKKHPQAPDHHPTCQEQDNDQTYQATAQDDPTPLAPELFGLRERQARKFRG